MIQVEAYRHNKIDEEVGNKKIMRLEKFSGR